MDNTDYAGVVLHQAARILPAKVHTVVLCFELLPEGAIATSVSSTLDKTTTKKLLDAATKDFLNSRETDYKEKLDA